MAGLLPLQLDQKTLLEENLKILRKTDPAVAGILGKAAHTAVYSFKQETSTWERKDTEGPFFIVERRPSQAKPSRFGMMILNRLNATNFVQPIHRGVQISVSDPYVIIQTKSEVLGFWFQNAEERNTITGLIQKSLQFAYQVSAPQQQPPMSATQQQMASQHLMSLIQGGTGGQGVGVGGASRGAAGQPKQLSADEVELTKPQLQAMLIRMLQDDRFIGLLHQQYVQSLRKRRGGEGR
jgi:mRNA-decapping enzyme 1B